jgi:hypothetical protein
MWMESDERDATPARSFPQCIRSCIIILLPPSCALPARRKQVSEIVIVCEPSWREVFEKRAATLARQVPIKWALPGPERQDSVFNGFQVSSKCGWWGAAACLPLVCPPLPGIASPPRPPGPSLALLHPLDPLALPTQISVGSRLTLAPS